MRAITLLAAVFIAESLVWASWCVATSPEGLSYSPQAVVKASLQSDDRSSVEFRGFGAPVKAETCRLYDRAKDKWRPVDKGGIAIHVRYRTTSPRGLAEPHSRIFFINSEGVVWKTAEPSGVRSTDPALLR